MEGHSDDEIRARVLAFGQGHLLQFVDQLSIEERRELLSDLANVNFERLEAAFKVALESFQNGTENKDDLLRPLEPSICGSTSEDPVQTSRWRELGLKAVTEGKVAVLLLAGGQGTRLGSPNPKGMYKVGLPSDKTLYQIQAERILRLQTLATEQSGVRSVIPWYIMTSEFTKLATIKFFEDHNYFGLDSHNVVVFEQYTIPCLDLNGNLMLESNHHICKAPDGNGGLYAALINPKHDILRDMETRGVACVHVYCVDNILVKMADPVFVGFCIERGAECGAKVVRKVNPDEKVGVICRCDGKYQVVEYSEISSQMAKKRNEDGSLVYSAGNICNHFFTIDFLKQVSRVHDHSLPYHVAKKKIPYVNSQGQQVDPAEPNGIKLEKFVFDVFQFTSHLTVLEVVREDEFSPLKNAPGGIKDTPETARTDLMRLNYRQLCAAGVEIERESESEVVECEISPLVSYFGEGLETFKGKKFRCPVLLN